MILFKAIVGSQAHGCNTANSDVDYKGVFHESLNGLLGTTYRQQIEHSKDHTSFEIKRYLELLQGANPSILELLNSSEDCIVEKHPAFDEVIKIKHLFVTKRCRDTFGGYARQQIAKALGQNKMMNWASDKVEKKNPIDFCYIAIDGKTYKFNQWLIDQKILESQVGLVKLDHAPHCFAVYISWNQKYKGIFGAYSDFVLTSSVPKDIATIGTLIYNRDSYQKHLSEWDRYQTWLKNKNESRYVDNVRHNQKVDSKNLCHTRRLLDMALEIPTKGIVVRRPNADYLLEIRRGNINLFDIIAEAEYDLQRLDEIYAKSDLPDNPPEIETTLLKIRNRCLSHS